jgi:GntR family transcriptional regulator
MRFPGSLHVPRQGLDFESSGRHDDRMITAPIVGEPRYLRLKREIREIIQRELKPGDRLPSESQICEQYGVSRSTTRQAMSALEYEGLVSKQQGRGTFVAHDVRREGSRQRAWPRNRELAAYEILSLDVIDADLHIAEPLGREPTRKSIARVRASARIDSAPASYHVLYVPVELIKIQLSDLATAAPPTMYAQLTGERVTGIEHSLSAARVDEFRAQVLELPKGAPVLLDQAVYRSEAGPRRALDRAFIESSVITMDFDEVP